MTRRSLGPPSRQAPSWAGWLNTLRGATSGTFRPLPGARFAYSLVILGLLFAAFLIAAAGGFFHSDSLRALGGNGAIVYSFGGNNHEAVVSVAMAQTSTGTMRALPDVTGPTQAVGWLSSTQLLVSARGCGGPLDLSALDVVTGSIAPLVTGLSVAAVRTPVPTPPAPLPRAAPTEGSGFG